MYFRKYPYYFQHDSSDCGPACLRMIARFYGKESSIEKIRSNCYLGNNGVSLLGISEGAQKLGFTTMMLKTTFKKLLETVPLPCILHWEQDHFVVLYEIKKGHSKRRRKFIVADPNGSSIVRLDESEFSKCWISNNNEEGILLALYPSENFLEDGRYKKKLTRGEKSLLFSFIKPYKRQFLVLLLGLFISSIILLAPPFLNQYLVDSVIRFKTREAIVLILLAQLAVFIGATIIDFIKSTVYLHVSNRLGISMVSDFIWKLMRLPINFFDTRSTGDINQRVQDHEKIETFLTSTSLNALFSLFNIILFSVILFVFNIQIFLIFIVFSVFSIVWVALFQGKRRMLNYKRFQTLKYSQNNIIEMISGIKDIKLNNSEVNYKTNWEKNQNKKYQINIKYLRNEQIQKGGFDFCNQLKNILIIYIAANYVISGSLTIGTMMSIMYLISQINTPLYQIVDFFKLSQDAKISFERRSDIENYTPEDDGTDLLEKKDSLRLNGDIHLNNIFFRYSGPQTPYILKDISFTIPKNKITAIVGPSGCGKTTLLKLLLKFYEPQLGTITVGEKNLLDINCRQWRENCGSVMQDGYIFSGSIAKNIAIENDNINFDQVNYATVIANINEFVNDLPMKLSTKIGAGGGGLSAGQKQRILIARAIYKDPQFILFDEATSALDARNERIIIENLNKYFVGKTVLIIAHRLSTVKNADQIIVMDKGEVIEVGDHSSLIGARGFYYELISNQLELA